MKNIQIQPVKSSNVKALGYDNTTKTLEVHFHSGNRYRYSDVPFEEFQALLAAPSVGSHFASRIRGKFTGTNLNAKEAQRG